MNSIARTNESDRRPGYLIPLARDFVSLGALGILLLIIHEGATPFTRGFNCDDESIRYPYKESTISSGVCYFVGSSLNVFLIMYLEYQALKREGVGSSADDGQFMRHYFRNTTCRLIIWLFGAISSELITDISKFTVGRLRPHFIHVCDPQIRDPSGQGISLYDYCRQDSHKYEYITEYRCLGNPSKLRDSRLSFMSGHSSYSSYSATFAVLYLQSAMDSMSMGLVKPALQVLIISAAFYTGLTRVSDYKHHWQDVLAGLSQGALMAIVITKFLWPAFKRTYTKYLTITTLRVGGDQTGEELNRVSY